jgi:hypothetical protein
MFDCVDVSDTVEIAIKLALHNNVNEINSTVQHVKREV